MKITSKPIGEAIKEYLYNNDKSYSDFKNDMGISRSYLSEIINKNIIPSDEMLKKISKTMGVKPFYFREIRKRKLSQYIDENPQILDFKNEGDLIEKINRLNIEEGKKAQKYINDDFLVPLIKEITSEKGKVVSDEEIKDARLWSALVFSVKQIYGKELDINDSILVLQLILKFINK